MNSTSNQEIIIQDIQGDGNSDADSLGMLQRIELWLLTRQKMSIKQKVIFFRLLATMANAGLPILKSLGILERQEKDPVSKAFYGKMISGIKSGKNLSATLREFDGIFTDAECSIIES